MSHWRLLDHGWNVANSWDFNQLPQVPFEPGVPRGGASWQTSHEHLTVAKSGTLPSLSIERDLLAAYFDQKGRSGFDYAYRFPGMQRVLQAVGRLIRSENDQGGALLVDRRFLEARYENLLPGWWRITPNETSDWDF